MTTSTRTRSMITSGSTAGAELLVFLMASTVLNGAALAAARWLIGASGSGVNFAVSRRWAFAPTGARKRAQGARWALISLSAVSLATLLWWSVVHWAGVDARVAHVGSVLGVWLFYTYPLMRRWVFKGS